MISASRLVLSDHVIPLPCYHSAKRCQEAKRSPLHYNLSSLCHSVIVTESNTAHHSLYIRNRKGAGVNAYNKRMLGGENRSGQQIYQQFKYRGSTLMYLKIRKMDKISLTFFIIIKYFSPNSSFKNSL